MTIHVYGKGNVIYEYVDRKLREKTVKMPIPELEYFTDKIYYIRQWLDKLKLADFVDLFIRISPKKAIIFDWYSAPIATHHSYKEVKSWYSELELDILKTNEKTIWYGTKIQTKNKFKLAVVTLLKKLIRPIDNGPITIRGIKN